VQLKKRGFTMPPVVNTGILAGQGVDFSASFWSIAAGMNKIHCVWKYYIKGMTYLNPDNFFGLSAGLVYETIIGDRLLLKLPTVPFFVMTRFLDLFEQEDVWAQQYHHWRQAIRCVQPFPAKAIVDCALYKISWFSCNVHCLFLRLQRIVFCTLHLGLESFKLVMRIMDIVELITLDPAKLGGFANQSVRESGLHIPRCLSVLVKNKVVIIQRLNQKKGGIEGALKLLGCKKIEAKDVITSVESMIADCEKGLEYYDQASSCVGEAVKNLGKKCIYDWSPEAIKQWLREHKLDPGSTQQMAFQIVDRRHIHRPNKSLLCYEKRISLKEKENLAALKQEGPVIIHHPDLAKQNTFGNAAKKPSGAVSPKKILKAAALF
jgi:hypothetical protein